MSDGVDRKRIRRHLLIFSLAAPLTAIVTFVLLKSVRFEIFKIKTKLFLCFFQHVQQSYSMNATGLAMLFSAGTFLFVATVHVLPEVQSHYDDRQFRAIELLILIFGSCCPIILSIGHKH